jgi:hypothetical protein
MLIAIVQDVINRHLMPILSPHILALQSSISFYLAFFRIYNLYAV